MRRASYTWLRAMDDDGEKRESEMERASEPAAILHSLVPPNEGSGLLLTTLQWKDRREEEEGGERWAWA